MIYSKIWVLFILFLMYTKYLRTSFAKHIIIISTIYKGGPVGAGGAPTLTSTENYDYVIKCERHSQK